MTNRPFRPEDALADQEDYKTVRGVRVRKGTIFAAMQNMEMLASGSRDEKDTALTMIRELAPALVALGVHDHFACRNPEVEAVLEEAAAKLDLKRKGHD